jgi:hypothetical protein
MKKATWSNKLIVIFTILLFGTILLSGCTSYYKVKDTGSGNVYYTTDVDRSGSGSIKFKDANTGSEVTLQSSEVSEINKEEFKANTKKNNPSIIIIFSGFYKNQVEGITSILAPSLDPCRRGREAKFHLLGLSLHPRIDKCALCIRFL